MNKKILTTALLLLTTLAGSAQQITYDSYMQRVMQNNTAAVAQAMNIDIAREELRSSKRYNDPTLSLQYANNEDWDKELGQSIAANLGCTFTFGVRRAGIRLAQKELQATTAVFNDYMRNLHADATLAYLRHIRAKELLRIAESREEYMQQLALSDSLRYLRGEIAKTAWIETRLAAGLTHNTRLQAEAQMRNTAVELGYYMGSFEGIETLEAAGTLDKAAGTLESPESYIDKALANRADIIAACDRVEIAEAERKLGRALRRTDLQLSVGAEYNKADPTFTKLMVGAAIPLKFSNLNRGARLKEQAKIKQAQESLADTRMMVTGEVLQAYNDCLAANKQKATFTRGMMNETAELLNSKRKAYQMGEISFVDFIETERSDNMMQEEYINALYQSAAGFVELERSVGVTIKTAE